MNSGTLLTAALPASIAPLAAGRSGFPFGQEARKNFPKRPESDDDLGTQSESVVGNSVPNAQSPPPVGATAKFDSYSAEYVGSGG